MAKVIAITGAGDGLGRALSRRLAADGDTVVLLGRTFAKVKAVADELNEANPGRHLAIECDVANPESVRTAFTDIAKVHPRLDVLINNAAVYEPFTLAEVRDDQILTQLMINLAGPIFCAREALPLLKGGGHIVNITSESSHLKMPMLWMYAGTKVGLEYISDLWVRELQPDGVRVTVVRAGNMMDETKTGGGWSPEVGMRFAQENAKVGLHFRERPISHYNSAAEAIRAVLNGPADVHFGLVTLSGAHP